MLTYLHYHGQNYLSIQNLLHSIIYIMLFFAQPKWIKKICFDFISVLFDSFELVPFWNYLSKKMWQCIEKNIMKVILFYFFFLTLGLFFIHLLLAVWQLGEYFLRTLSTPAQGVWADKQLLWLTDWLDWVLQCTERNTDAWQTFTKDWRLAEPGTHHRMHKMRQQTADVQIDRHHRQNSTSEWGFTVKHQSAVWHWVCKK